MSLLSITDLVVRFYTREGMVTAVDGVSFSVAPGQVMGIVGESGSGKSVCCYSLLGLIPSPPGCVESGAAIFAGNDLLKMNAKQLRQVRGNEIGMIFQDPMTSLTPHMRIGTQLTEPLLRRHSLSTKAAESRAIAALEEVGIDEASRRIHSYPHEFSGGMRQRVMIAMALISKPRLLIADEPTTALDVTVQAQILELIKRIQREHNLAVIFISHDLGVVSRVADDVLVMKDGKAVERGPSHQIFHQAQHPYTQKLIAAIPNSAKSTAAQLGQAQRPILVAEGLNLSYRSNSGFFSHRNAFEVNAVKDVNLRIRRGEVLGLVGESGSGKSSLARIVMRLIEPDSGRVSLDGTDLMILSAEELRLARRDFQMIFQDPYASLNPRMTVFDALAEPMLTHRLVARANLLQEVNALMEEVGLHPSMIRKYPHEFSGGQRQRIAIARALAVRPKLIVADEAVSALDVTIQAQILELLIHLTQKHQLALLFISHDLSVVRSISDRVMVMQKGEVVEVGDTETLFLQPTHVYTKSLLSALPRVL